MRSEEVELAEVLIDLHPWCKGGMARFARGGGEVDMLAARIARSATNRDRIAICGYHGWTDWYIGANFDDESAGGQALAADPRYVTEGTGHGTLGVPSQIAGSSVAWDFDRLDELRAIFEAYPGEIAAVMMEVCRSTDPPPGHLETVRELCTANGALLIFDEVSSAWRETLGGRHLMYNVAPDMCTFSKTISNGFAMAAVIGTREAMADASASFISTTYHTERVGPAAALATIAKMKRCDVQAHNCAMGATAADKQTTQHIYYVSLALPFYALKMITLPRQARDKHRESSTHKREMMRFPQAASSGRAGWTLRITQASPLA